MKAPPRWGQAVAAATTNTMSMSTLGFPLGKRMSWQVAGAGIAPGKAQNGFQAERAARHMDRPAAGVHSRCAAGDRDGSHECLEDEPAVTSIEHLERLTAILYSSPNVCLGPIQQGTRRVAAPDTSA